MSLLITALLLGAAFPRGSGGAGRPTLVPTDWLVIASPGERGDGPCAPDPVFARYLLDPRAEPPSAGEGLDLTADEELRWVARELSEGAELSAPGGYAYTSVSVPEEQVRLAYLQGARTLYVNGDGFTGDALRRGFGGVPVALRAGRNDLYVTGVESSFRLELRDPGGSLVIETRDVDIPAVTSDPGDGDWVFGTIRPTLFNASTEAVRYLHLHYGSPVPDSEGFAPKIDEWADGDSIAPLSLIKPSVIFSLQVEIPADLKFESALFPIEIQSTVDNQVSASLRVDLLRPGAPRPSGGLRNPVREAALARRELDGLPRGLLGELVSRPCLLVVGTAGDEVEDRALLTRARYDLQRLWSRYNIAPELITDDELFGALLAADLTRPFSNVILYGNEDTNSFLRSQVPNDSPVRVERGKLTRGGELHEGPDLLCVFGFTCRGYGEAAAFEVGVLASSGPSASRLGYALSLWEAPVELPAEGLLFDASCLTADGLGGGNR